MNKAHAISFLKNFKKVHFLITENIYFDVSNYGDVLSKYFNFEYVSYKYGIKNFQYNDMYVDLDIAFLNIIDGIPNIKSHAKIISLVNISESKVGRSIAITLAIATKRLYEY
jgi:hypothetical protein